MHSHNASLNHSQISHPASDHDNTVDNSESDFLMNEIRSDKYEILAGQLLAGEPIKFIMRVPNSLNEFCIAYNALINSKFNLKGDESLQVNITQTKSQIRSHKPLEKYSKQKFKELYEIFLELFKKFQKKKGARAFDCTATFRFQTIYDE